MAKVIKLDLSTRQVYIPDVLEHLLVSLTKAKRKVSIIYWVRVAIFLKGKPDSKTSRILEYVLSYYEEHIPEHARKILKEAIIPQPVSLCKTVGKLSP